MLKIWSTIKSWNRRWAQSTLWQPMVTSRILSFLIYQKRSHVYNFHLNKIYCNLMWKKLNSVQDFFNFALFGRSKKIKKTVVIKFLSSECCLWKLQGCFCLLHNTMFTYWITQKHWNFLFFFIYVELDKNRR